MPIDEAITVHTTIQTSVGETFRVSSGTQVLGALGGTSTFTLTCSSACIVETINGWTGANTDDADVVFIVNISGPVDILDADLASPTNNALGDLSDGAGPSNVIDLLKMIQSVHNSTAADQATVETISVAAGGTVAVKVINSVDANADAEFVVVFTGKNLGLTTPTFAFTAE